jgi:hypothetical protein
MLLLLLLLILLSLMLTMLLVLMVSLLERKVRPRLPEAIIDVYEHE